MQIGRIVEELSPSPVNCRNSEGSFIRMDDGRIAFAYSRYGVGTSEDGEPCDLAVIFSSDEGETFTEPRVFLTHEECDAMNIMSVSLLKMNDGSIGVFYLKKSKGLQCVCYMRRTKDFITLSEEVRCITTDGYYCVNNDRIRRLSNGRIIVASSYAALKPLREGVDHGDYKDVEASKGVGINFYSDDDGYTWQIAPGKTYLNDARSSTGIQEPGYEELDNGKIYFYYRNDLGCQYEAFSDDMGLTCTEAKPSRFTAPTSPMSSKRLSDGRIVIVYNPVPLTDGRSENHGRSWTGGRNPFVLRVVDGNFEKVGKMLEVENDETRGFCYCAIFETEKSLLLAYCAGGAGERSTLMRIRIRKIDKEEIK